MINKTERIFERITSKGMNTANMLIMLDKYVPGKFLMETLDDWQYNIVGICQSGQEVLTRIRQDKVELILTDIDLKDCSGVNLNRLSDTQADFSSLYIYFTSFATELIIEQVIDTAIDYGCNIIRNDSDGSYKKFESIFCQQFGISQTKSFIKHLTAKPIQILLVDDQQIVLWGLEKLIESKKPRMEVIGSVTNTDDALLLVEQKQPDVVILNIKLNGADCLHSISSFTRNEHTKIVIFTEIEEMDLIDQAVLNGARGIVHRKESMQVIVRAIEKIHEGELWLDRRTTGRIFLQNSRLGRRAHNAGDDKITSLTRKECMILQAFSDGAGGEQNKQIAAKLCMSEHTLRNHLTSIFSKLGIKNRFSLFAYAKQHFPQAESNHSMRGGYQKNR